MKMTKEQFILQYKSLTVAQMARLNGVNRVTIWRKAKQLGLAKLTTARTKFDF